MKKLLEPVTRLDMKEALDEAFEKYDDKNRKYRDQVLSGLDGVMKELENIREDNIIETHQISSLREEVDNHEKRISKLESPTP